MHDVKASVRVHRYPEGRLVVFHGPNTGRSRCPRSPDSPALDAGGCVMAAAATRSLPRGFAPSGHIICYKTGQFCWLTTVLGGYGNHGPL